MENSQPGFVRKGWKSFINDPNTLFLASGMVNKVKCKCANSSAVLRLCFPALGSLYMLSPRFRNHLRSISGALFPHFGAR